MILQFMGLSGPIATLAHSVTSIEALRRNSTPEVQSAVRQATGFYESTEPAGDLIGRWMVALGLQAPEPAPTSFGEDLL